MAGSLTAQQSALLEAQRQFNVQNQTFQTEQEIETAKDKGAQTHHDALLAVIEGMKGQ